LIGRLVGLIVEDSADGTLVLDVRGVGYELTVPLGTVGRATPDASHDGGGAITLFVHTHVREDAFVLYGFATREDRAVFRQLIGVSNIGPKIALSILGALPVAELAHAVHHGEVAKLTRVPGVGKKTAERIVLELKDKILAPPPLAGAPAPAPRPAARGAKAELLHGALTRMGYRPAEAERAVAALGARVEAEPLADLVREALGVLAP
jgi:Holliday junction DNA helicase RuvA